MSGKDKQKAKKRVMAGIAILLSITMVLSLIAPFLSYGMV